MSNPTNQNVSFFGKENFSNFKLSKETFSFDWSMVAGHKVMEHLHIEVDEVFEVTKGELTFKIQNEIKVVKTGESLKIPKGIGHEVNNKGTSEASASVSFFPASDQGKFFDVCLFLIKENPSINGQMGLVIKAFYINQRVGHKDFSTPSSFASKMMFNILIPPTNFIGWLSGWNKLVEKYKQQKSNN